MNDRVFPSFGRCRQFQAVGGNFNGALGLDMTIELHVLMLKPVTKFADLSGMGDGNACAFSLVSKIQNNRQFGGFCRNPAFGQFISKRSGIFFYGMSQVIEGRNREAS